MTKPKHTPPRTGAIGYIRTSTDDQSLSVEAQEMAIRRWCWSKHLSLLALHVDAGVSGGTPIAERPGLLRALVDLERDGLHLVAAKRDRLARDVVIAAQLEALVAKFGATIRTADGASEGDNSSSELMKTIQDAFSAFERARIRERTREALAVKRSKGECVGHVPYGFERDGARLVPNKAEQYNLNRIKHLRERGYSASTVSEILAADGRFNRNGKPFCVSDVYRLQAGTRRAKVGEKEV